MHARSASLVDSRSERPAIGEDEDAVTIDRFCVRVRVKPTPSMRDTDVNCREIERFSRVRMIEW